jgi:hypothetical protein
MVEELIVGKAQKVVKAQCISRREFSPADSIPRANQAERNASQSAIGNTTTRYCIFPLDTTRTPAQNPRNFFRGFPVEGIGAVKRKRFAANGGP